MHERSLTIPPEWRDSIEDIVSRAGPIVVVGALGSGKTTFSLFLTGHLCKQKRRVAWLDADPGQPFIGPPSVISLHIYSEAEDLLKRKNPACMYFVGNTTPIGRLLEMTAGIQKLYTAALAMRPDLILVNMSGLVDGGAARELAFHLIDMVSPRSIVAIQKGTEIEHLLAPHAYRAGLIIHRLPVSPDALPATGERRRAIREQRFKEYFRGSDFQEISLPDVGIHGPGLGTGERLGFRDTNKLSKILQAIVVHAEAAADRLFLITDGDFAEDEIYTARAHYNVREVMAVKRSELDHLLVGLNDEYNLCSGLGIARIFDLKDLTVRVITPVRDISGIRHLSLGSIRVSPTGKELGQV